MQIDGLDLVESTGFTKNVIITAYNDMLNYLTLPWAEFKTGALKYSSTGAQHFKDVKVLFNLNAGVLVASAIVVVVLNELNKKGVITFVKFKNRSAYFYSGVINVLLPLVIGVFALIDFETAFYVFHYIFFPGKSNWIFNPYTDQIITILPIEFFASCAVLIGVALIVISLIYIIIDRKK